MFIVIGLGLGETIGRNALGGGYDYRATVVVWFRRFLLLNPKPDDMVGAPLVYQLHVVSAWLLMWYGRSRAWCMHGAFRCSKSGARTFCIAAAGSPAEACLRLEMMKRLLTRLPAIVHGSDNLRGHRSP
ncbi:MAG: respiratory nitrate reductase subunit gamma [Gaiellales bacterium]